MKYTVCEKCGAFLDFGEICDCEKNGAAPSAKETTPESVPTEKIPHSTDYVKAALDLANVLRGTKAQYKDVAETVKETFPKFNRQLLTACVNWQNYGVILHPGGVAAIYDAYDVPRMAKKEHRTLDRRITFRCSSANYARIEQGMAKTGANTLQEFVAAAVSAYIKEIEK